MHHGLRGDGRPWNDELDRLRDNMIFFMTSGLRTLTGELHRIKCSAKLN